MLVDPNVAVMIGGYLLVAACMCGFLWMLGKLELNKWVAGKLSSYTGLAGRLSLFMMTVSFFGILFIAAVTVHDPPRMARYLNNICVPLWNNLLNY